MFGVSQAARPAAGSSRAVAAAAKAKKKGFGQTGTLKQQGKVTGKNRPEIRYLQEAADGDAEPGTSLSSGLRPSKPRGEFWFKVADAADFGDKDKKVVQTKTGKQLMIYMVDDKAYCSDAMSTAYQFPLVDAKVTANAQGPVVEVPLDGTTYNLKTGEVIEWCPKNNPIRGILGALKATQRPINLPVYDCVLTNEDEVYVKLTKAA